MEEFLKRLETIEELKKSFESAKGSLKKSRIFKLLTKERNSFFQQYSKFALRNKSAKEMVEKEILSFLDLQAVVSMLPQTNTTFKNNIDSLLLEFEKGKYISSEKIEEQILIIIYDMHQKVKHNDSVVDRKNYRYKLLDDAWNYIKPKEKKKNKPEEK